MNLFEEREPRPLAEIEESRTGVLARAAAPEPLDVTALAALPTVSDSDRATVEAIDVEVRRGDWLVFNVVNNRLRWGGARYFAVAGIKEGSGTAFTTDLTTGRWTCCDDPSQAAAFIADPRFLRHQLARGIETRWDQGDALMNQHADGWHGSAAATPRRWPVPPPSAPT